MIKLERFNLSDANAYLEIAKDKNAKKFFRLAYCENIEEAQDLMELCVFSSNYEAFKIIDMYDEIVGIILGEKKPKKSIEVSYFISERNRRKGYCKEAIIKFARYVVESTKFEELQFCIRHNNRPSRAFMEKNLRIKAEYMTKEFIYYKKKATEF